MKSKNNFIFARYVRECILNARLGDSFKINRRGRSIELTRATIASCTGHSVTTWVDEHGSLWVKRLRNSKSNKDEARSDLVEMLRSCELGEQK